MYSWSIGFKLETWLMISSVRVWEVLQLERVAISPRVRTGGALEPIRLITIVVQGNQT